jgi:hypothetical protein
MTRGLAASWAGWPNDGARGDFPRRKQLRTVELAAEIQHVRRSLITGAERCWSARETRQADSNC